jgi:RES domain-containing protein
MRMAALPERLGLNVPLVVWRVDREEFAATWDSGIGAERVGGRWNPIGVRAVYASLDPATAILEVAVHKGFKVLDTQPHVMTGIEIASTDSVIIVEPEAVPNPAWLQSGLPGAGQQAFGAALLAAYDALLIPSAVSRHSWNLVFSPERGRGKFRKVEQRRLAIDTRLNPPVAAP